MKQHAKAASTGSTRAGGSSRGASRSALVPRAASGSSEGTGAPSSRRLRATLAALALAVAAFAISAAPASAAPLAVEMGAVTEASYTSAHVTGKVTTPGAFFYRTAYAFEYSTDKVDWNVGLSGSLGEGAAVDKEVEGQITVPNGGGVEYYVRLHADTLSDSKDSPEPYPSFTTLTVDPPSVVSVDNASDVAYTTATVKGEVQRPADPDPAFDVDCRFQYVTDEQFQVTGFTVDPGSVPCEGTNPIKAPGASEVEAHLIGLAEDTEYHLRLFVSNASPTTDAEEAASTFTTLPVDPPSVKSIDNASDVEYTQAQVKGVVERPANADPAFDVNCHFEYVTDQQFNENATGEEFAGAVPVDCNPNPVTAADTAPGTTKAVSATLTDLVPETTYHLRLAVSNLGGSDAEEAAATFTTAGPVPGPSIVAVDEASDMTLHEATVKAEVQRPAGKDPALDVNCRFEYVSDKQFDETGFTGAPSAPCVENPIDPGKVDGEGKATVSAQLGGLKAGTTFHLRLVAENNLGGNVDTEDAADTFTTLAADVPVVTIDPVAPGTYTTAHVSGTVSGGGNCRIEISTDDQSWNPLVELNNQVCAHLEYDITGLQPLTTYYFRLIASFTGASWQEKIELGEVGYSPEPNPSITTGELFPPTADNLAVTDITATSAHFSGTVDPHAPAGTLNEAGKKAFATHWEFVCVPECKDKNENPIEGTIQGEEGAQTVTADVKRLEPGTEYTVSLVVSNEGGGDTEEKAFPTAKSPPSVKQAPGASDGSGGYTLEGVVNPNNETITDCEFRWGSRSNELVFKADCSPLLPDPGAKPTTVEAHLTGLNTGVDYYSKLVVTYAADPVDLEADSGPAQKFKAELAAKEPCPANEQQRVENDSLALPECRAYEMVSSPGKEGFGASLQDFYGSVRVLYTSVAANIAKSGQSTLGSKYVAVRSAAGWETIPNLNGTGGGTIGDAPSSFVSFGSGTFPSPIFYSEDLLSSVWSGHRRDGPDGGDGGGNYYLRKPDGIFTLIGPGAPELDSVSLLYISAGASDDLSHVFYNPHRLFPTPWGPGVYEFVGTGNVQPRRADVDNLGSPITTCHFQGTDSSFTAYSNFNSRDGRVLVFMVAGGCGDANPPSDGANPPTNELWARVDGTTTIDVSASRCNRSVADPGGVCNGPVGDGGCATVKIFQADFEAQSGCRGAKFQGAADDGSRIFFTTKRQLLDADTDESSDLYACDIPADTAAPTAEQANHCAALTQVSAGYPTGADVESVSTVSSDGSTVLFTAKGVLAKNEDALGKEAVAGDHNLYLWRTDAAHSTGRRSFVGRLDTVLDSARNFELKAQATPDGRFPLFTTASRLLDTDTDSARDVYRYDADTGELTRVSTNVVGVAGNGKFNAQISGAIGHNPTTAISDDGQKIVFTTSEPLNLAVDGNEEPDIYLWTPDRVSLISTGSSGFAPRDAGADRALNPTVAINPSGEDVYFESAQPLSPADVDDSNDVYDARVGGGFSFSEAEKCSGEKCQPDPVLAQPTPPSPANTLDAEGNTKPPKPCPKGKVRKKGKCVKKHRKHSVKKHPGKNADHKRGGGK